MPSQYDEDGASILSRSLGVSYTLSDVTGPGLRGLLSEASHKDLIKGVDLDRSHPVSSLVQRFLDNPLPERIADRFGQYARFQYEVVAWAMTAGNLANFANAADSAHPSSTEAKFILEHEVKSVNSYVDEFVSFMKENEQACMLIDPTLPKAWGKLVDLLGNNRRAPYARIASECIGFVNQLLPLYDEIVASHRRAYNLIMRICECPSGRSNWRAYEEICVDALTYALVPPFSAVHVQVTGAGGSARRDAILDNGAESGFWKRIRDDFNGRHVVCEFKNRTEPIGSADLHGLRVYLTNPAVGRFGLLFTRKRPSATAAKAQQAAFREAGMLILIVDDEGMQEILKERTFLGTADGVLERMRNEFEVGL